VTPARALYIARKALTSPPGFIVGRLRDETRRVLGKPWSHVYPAILSDRQVIAAAGAESIDALWDQLADAPFFLHPADRDRWVTEFTARYPNARAEIIDAAERVLRHEFDLLGSGRCHLGPQLPWHDDFKTGRSWPVEYSLDIEFSELDRPTDVKVPWELSRCQHFPLLGQAYWLTGDERYAQEYVDQVTDWIARNPWGQGVNWICAMDVALRAVNWIWGFYFFADSAAAGAQSFRGEMLRSLYLHGSWVRTHLEKGAVNGNHYLSDGVGLVFLGAFFRRTSAGQAWLDTGRAIVIDEMLAQVSEDGVDFEGSTAYHRLVLELFLTAYQLLRVHGERIPDLQWQRLERMIEFVEAYVKPSGLAPLVGDADDGRVQVLGRQAIGDHRYLLSSGAAVFGRGDFKRRAGAFAEESFWLLGPDAAIAYDSLEIPPSAPASKRFAEGGYCVLRDGATHLFIDCANVGMNGIGGHGHNDVLSFELVLDGVPIVTDCGAYLYTSSREWRNRFRSTSFHATIQVDGEEINRFIGPDALWQLHNDAQPIDVSLTLDERCDRFRGAHDGYQRLKSPVRVAREFVLGRAAIVGIVDRVDGTGEHELDWRFPLEPGLTATIHEQDVRFESNGRERWLLMVGADAPVRWTIEPGWVSPSYGVKHPTSVLRLRERRSVPYRMTYLFTTTFRSSAARIADAALLGLN
jgi:hypothetical protein